MRRKLGLLALTAGLALGLTAPAQAEITFQPSPVEFGSLALGSAPKTLPVQIEISADHDNFNRKVVSISTKTLAGPNLFTQTNDCPEEFAPSVMASCTAQVTFTPSAVGDYSAFLDVVMEHEGSVITRLLGKVPGPPAGPGTAPTTTPATNDEKAQGKGKGKKKGKKRKCKRKKRRKGKKKGCGKKKGKGKKKGGGHR